MARPTSRVLTLLELLQSGGTRTVAELADRLGVDERTVRRYVQHLLELDVPVEAVRGRYGGYRLARGFRTAPLMLSDEEALEVVLGLAAARRAGSSTASATANETAFAKVRRLLPERLVRRLDAVLETAEYTDGPHENATPDAAVLLTVAEAVREHRPVSLRYGEAPQRRSLHPYGLVSHAGRWYVTGLDVGRGESRTFRLDRITWARSEAGTFRPPAGFDAAQHVLDGMASAPYRHPVVLIVEATEPEIRRRLPASVARLEPLTGDGRRFRVEIRAERLDWLPALLAQLDRPFVIETPAELRTLVAELAARLAQWADAGSATRT
ncbi:helix-turn-helix transcriptional regulator [Spongisporangium articulatum]|uniref:Helix-turn-helix transcriptional regulator n=1 Tax=Spongisporangium articulatum TaxID=3362603 RepID=A0ABW8AGK5_9ACTN